MGTLSVQLQRRRQSAIDDEVGACDISCPATGQHKHQVGNFLRLSEPAGHGIFGSVICDGIRLTARCPRDNRGDTVTSEPKPSSNGSRADHVDPDAARTDLFGQCLAEVCQRSLRRRGSRSQ